MESKNVSSFSWDALIYCILLSLHPILPACTITSYTIFTLLYGNKPLIYHVDKGLLGGLHPPRLNEEIAMKFINGTEFIFVNSL